MEEFYDIKCNEYNIKKLPFISVAHRGLYSLTVDENTMDAFKNAYESGYDAVETDVRITSDGIYILSHNETIGGVTVSSSTYDQIKSIYADICKLDEVLLYCYKHNMKIILDMKIADANMAERVNLFGMSGKTWYNINSNSDLISRIVLIDPKASFHVLMNASNDYSSYLSSATIDKIALTVSGENISLYKNNIVYARKNGYALYVYDISSSTESAALAVCAEWQEPNSAYELSFISNARKWVES